MRRATVKRIPVPSELSKETMGRRERGVIQTIYNGNLGRNKAIDKANFGPRGHHIFNGSCSRPHLVRARMLLNRGSRRAERGMLLPRSTNDV